MTSERPLISVRELTKTYRIGGDVTPPTVK